MNERKPSWVCPVCDQKAYYSDLFKDGLFLSIIEEEKNCDEIDFFEDGSWKPLTDVQQGSGSKGDGKRDCSSSPSANGDDSDEDDKPLKQLASVADTKPTNGNDDNAEKEKSNDEPEPDVIILDDSDSDEPTTPVADKSSTNTQPSEVVAPRFTSVSGVDSPTPMAPLPYPAPELQSFDLYNIPREDRIAATAYLNQHALLSTQVAVNASRSSGIIDISDE